MRAPRPIAVLVLALALGGSGDDTPETAAPPVERRVDRQRLALMPYAALVPLALLLWRCNC